MNRLHIIDNPESLALDRDTVWLEALLSEWQPGDKLLLAGFQPEDLITVRRTLSSTIPEADMLCITAPSQRALSEADPALLALALQGIESRQRGNVHLYHSHAGQASRQSLFVAEETPEPVRTSKPSLAFVSPLPPEATGIADYSAELLPYLAEHYRITLVVGQADVQPSLAQRFEVLTPERFDALAGQFDRVLYQIGNSPYHAYQFDLLRRHPGVVVLHDVYLFDAVWWLKDSGRWPDGLRRQLFHDHGFPAVLAMDVPDARPDQRGPDHYPVNGFVTHEASGLIYHSAFASELDRHWRPDAWREEVAVVPHLRELPTEVTPALRQQARRALGIDDDTCLIASFGGINPKKMTDTLVDALLEHEWGDTPVHLVLVGAQHAGEFGRQLSQRIRRHQGGKRISITGYVDREDYLRWHQAADIAVQLRQQSRGESSGAILDAMAHGLAVVANAHGSSAELPGQGVVMLPDRVTVKELADCLRHLVADAGERQRLGDRARSFVQQELDPVAVAERYRDGLETLPRASLRQRRERWLDRLAEHPVLKHADPETFHSLTRRLVEFDTLAPATSPRILFDVSTIAWHDLKTGIERVTRRLADHLLRHPPVGWRVELVRWGGDDFHLARGFACEQLGIHPPAPDRPCQARPGDIYVSVEWAPPLLEQAGHALKEMRARGVRCYFTVHDLLPLRLPHCFPDDIPERMRGWFEGIAALADGITTVSATVADDVSRELDALDLAYPPWIRHFHLGADFSGQDGDGEVSQSERVLLEQIEQRDGATLLMVGTLEPRKGHLQVLDALEQCWSRHVPLNLVVVGKQGWDVEDLARRLRHHSRDGEHLAWIEGGSDALLQRLYASCDGLVAASMGEGFGLPLIEAAHHGIPVLARDIPVFREVAGKHADYFHADSADELAEELETWQRRWQVGQLRSSSDMPYQSWAQSAEQWLGHIIDDQPVPLAPGQPLGDT